MADKLSIQWSVDKFNKFIQNFAKQTQLDGVTVLRKFTFDALTRIVARTPVDTGRARYGWSAAGDALGVKIPRPNRRRAGDAPFDRGEYVEVIGGPQMSITFGNNVPYIIPLEYGWSKQAPLGMVRITFAEMRAGKDLSSELLDEWKDSWQNLSGKQRYRTNARLMRAVVDTKDQVITRGPKPAAPRRKR